MALRENIQNVSGFPSQDGGVSFSADILAAVAQIAKDIGGSTLKAGAITTTAGLTGAGIMTASPTLMAAGAVGVTALAVNETMESEREQGVEKAPMETAHGGVNYQDYLNTSNSNTTAIASPEADVKDPFEAFRLCMSNAGLESVSHASTNNITQDYSCLSQSQARQRSHGGIV